MMSGAEAGEPAAFLDLWRDKIFLGREFLTWLWITSEINGNLLNLKPQGAVELWFESRLTLESGEGAGRKIVICQDPDSKWAEALTAVKEGKKVARGRLRLRTEEKEWGLTLSADTLTPQAVKFPRTSDSKEGDSGPGLFLERAALLTELVGLINSLCRQFLELRLTEAWAAAELPRLNKWLAGRP
ncbi:MAG: hypothetical protein LBV21_03015 [Candidatus Adiutrix sp.]|jgi:hypothetical protein|nr:hypothetical protein [Candidatus Adiutrix sp.]